MFLHLTSGKILSIAFILISTTVINAGKWSYEGHKGVKNWHSLFPKGCSGLKQSPININTLDTVEDPGLKDFALWYDPPKPGSKFIIHNNGHTVQADTEGDFFVTNGGLTSIYRTAQFHFHWGHHNHQGSEHTIDGKAAPIELHIVNYDTKYDSIVEAMVTEPNGLAVLGVMYEVSERDNPMLEPLIIAMKRVRDPELKMKVGIPAIPIRDFLPEDSTKYFRYNGSLTTPGCFESVIWTVFAERQHISHRQLREFRLLLKSKNERKYGRHRRHHRRSKRESAVEQVMEEAGIKGNAKEESELMKQMVNKAYKEMGNHNNTDGHSGSHGNGLKPTIGDGPEKFHLYEDETPDMEKEKSVVHDTTKDEHPSEESRWVNIKWEKFGLSPDNLVNNFRPVQPVNDRVILRSFSLYDLSPPEVTYIIDEEEPQKNFQQQSGNNNNNNANGASSVTSVSIVILMINILCGIYHLL